MPEKNKLELFMASLIEAIDEYTRVTKGSGNKNEILDTLNKFFYIECRQDHNTENFIIKRIKDWILPLMKTPVYSEKEFIVAKENKYGEVGIWMDAQTFLRLIIKAYKEK